MLWWSGGFVGGLVLAVGVRHGCDTLQHRRVNAARCRDLERRQEAAGWARKGLLWVAKGGK
ncbi:hypothetical protein [Sulfobacillus harzensis]|uniref:Uncharacterized protein n=1 Tax=Sulfobacillus harzensis TaxID=2729629 RepID=A0A7Y0Q4A8_9FIRM|nr:hypothetical protein [Sulfobacillus harzensis]NMP23806.1 hypothetical protein [Sulfobacillus harzensis]